MRERAHRRLSEAVAQQLWPNTDCWLLVTASATADSVRTVPRHHPTRDSNNVSHIQNLTRRARHQYLRTGFSEELQKRLGDIFHLVQDGFISSDSMEEHNILESQVSRHLEQFVFYGVDAQSLTSLAELYDFL